MATRRFQRRAPRVRRRIFRSPLRTRAVKEAKWNVSRIVTARQFEFDGEAELNFDTVILSPRLMLELVNQPAAGPPVTNIGPLINTMNAGTRGVKVGGIVWDSHFVLTQATRDVENAYVSAWARCTETLWTLNIDTSSGLPIDVPQMHETWRPIRVDDSVFTPGEHDETLVRIHHTRSTLVAAGNNAVGVGGQEPVGLGTPPFGAAAATVTQPNWGGTRSLRLRKFISDEQQLSFNTVIDNPNDLATDQASFTWTISATVYWAMQNQR